jgi:hypothetical protein
MMKKTNSGQNIHRSKLMAGSCRALNIVSPTESQCLDDNDKTSAKTVKFQKELY